jgi:hypothetical protein
VVDGIIHYGGFTHVFLDSTLRERIMRAMYDSPLAVHCGYSYEYEALQVTWIISKEVFRLHRLLGYTNHDQDRRFSDAFWQELNK